MKVPSIEEEEHDTCSFIREEGKNEEECGPSNQYQFQNESQSLLGMGNHSFYEYMHEIDNFKSVEDKREAYNVLRPPPLSSVPETSSMLSYEMKDMQTCDYLSNFNECKSKAKGRDLEIGLTNPHCSPLSSLVSPTLHLPHETSDEFSTYTASCLLSSPPRSEGE